MKSHCIIFGKSYKLSMQPVMLGFNCIQWVDCMKYLGVHVCSGKNLPFDIAPVKRSFYAVCNSIYTSAKSLSFISHEQLFRVGLALHCNF